ncbi:hypothetical protein [Kitasatospora purpeofusca]|uniref:hypothetical protein n=1 Tax=Kitasatospora purpeofusca TaxID=67352 RepID=UPI00367EF2E0
MPPHNTPHHTYRPLPPDAGMGAQIADLDAEAERQLRQHLWDPTEEDAALARKTASGLAEAVGEAAAQERLPVIDRLEHLREALAVLAIALARIHGPLAWYLAQSCTALSPVLRWRALPADGQSSFGTVVPSPSDLTDAEQAVRRLHTALTRAATGTATGADAGIGTDTGTGTGTGTAAKSGAAGTGTDGHEGRSDT